MGGSLAIVLGLFLVVAWAMRKAAPRGSMVLPREVFDILGRAALGARQQVQLLRCGNKLLLVSITPAGVETLTEVTDPLEVDRIAGVCQQSNLKSATAAFRQVFQQLAPASGEPSELDDLAPAGAGASATAGRKEMPDKKKSHISNLQFQISIRINRVAGQVCRAFPWVLPALVVLAALAPVAARAEDPGARPLAANLPAELSGGPEKWVSPQGLSSTIQVMLLLTVLGLAPSILLMTTCFVRVAVVLSMLRQALGTQTLPPNQVLLSLAMFVTLLVMAPTWKHVYDDSIVPYTHQQIGLEDAWKRGTAPSGGS